MKKILFFIAGIWVSFMAFLVFREQIDQILDEQEQIISNDLDSIDKQIKEVFGIDLMQIQNADNNLNLRHLLKATEHLRMAQREFQIAKQLSSGKKN